MKVELAELDGADAELLAALAIRNRADIERTEPPRNESFYRAVGQRARITAILAATKAGSLRWWTIRVDGHIAGEISVSGIERGAFLNGHVGYLVDGDHRGRGVATMAVWLAMARAFGEMGLHRLEAGVMAGNLASQRVLDKTGFSRIGMAPSYLFVGGAWRDHYLYQLVGPDFPPPPPPPPRAGLRVP